MSGQADVQFLALLVHRGHVSREEAERVLARMRLGEEQGLDALLASELGWGADLVERMRRTSGGEVPEIPGYEVLGQLGTGGTAEVFRVREKKTGRVLALKILNVKSTKNDAIRAQFVNEARLLEKLDHKGLVKGLGVAKSGTTYFGRLECVAGQTLLEMLDDGHVFPEEAALRIVLEVAEVLAYMAEEGLVHRDVKPGNIMLSPQGQVKLIDLGFAARADQASANSDSAVGTVAYLSPEQARGGAAADLRSDVYSLGVTLFHLVVGRLPFDGSQDEDVLRAQVMQSLTSPELKGRGLSPHLHYFIEKMMAKDAEHRYQSWQELVDDVRGQIEGRAALEFDRPSEVKKAAPRRRRF